MAGPVVCGGQHCRFCGHHVRERLPQELGLLHCSLLGPPLFSAPQRKPTSWAIFSHVKLLTFFSISFKICWYLQFGMKCVFWNLF